ncbi:MAG TPA: hypothetical protein GYA08_22450 [Chloroflexi bacterium]|nr:hypothetical protein [Chloroflexota bacterium]
MSNSQPHPMSARHHVMFPDWRSWRLLEIMLWSVIGWFYWMAFMVLLVWAVAQWQVQSTLSNEPELVAHLHEYARIGRNWQPLSTTADIARPMLAFLQSQESDLLMYGLRQASARAPLPSTLTLAAIETSLETVVYVGDEMRGLTELQRTAADIERYLAEPGFENLRAAKQSSVAGAEVLQQAQQDFDSLVAAVEPVVRGGDYLATIVAGGLRSAAPLVSIVGLEQAVAKFSDFLVELSKNSVVLVNQADQYSRQAADDTVLLYSIHEAIVTADLRESICTYGVFRSFIGWFLQHVWWINAVAAAAILIRLFIAYSRRFFSTGRQSEPGFVAAPTI